MLEKTLESPLDCKEIQPVSPKENQSWIIIGRTDAEAATPILWLSDEKNWLIGKDPDAGKDWRQEGKDTTEGEMVDDITDSMDMSLSKLWKFVRDQEAWCAAIHRVAKSHTGLRNLTDPWIKSPLFFMPPGHFTMDQMYGFKINNHQLSFPQAYGREVNYCPLLWFS